MGLCKEVKDALDIYMVGKTLTDGDSKYQQRFPLEYKNYPMEGEEPSLFIIRRNRSGNNFEIHVDEESNEIQIEFYHIITMITKEELFTTFPKYNIRDQVEVSSYIVFDANGRQIQHDKKHNRQTYEFWLNSTKELEKFIKIVDRYI